MKRVSIRTYHDTRQRDKANGRWPVKLVVYCPQVKPARKPYTLHWPDGEKCEVTPEEYRRANLKRVPGDARALNALIEQYKVKARRIVEGMQDFSFNAFERAFIGNTDPLCIIADLKAKAATFRTGSGANYKNAASAIKRHTGRDTLSYNAITPTWAREFVAWLEVNQDLSGDTVRLYIGLIKSMIKQRREDGDLRHDFRPFAKIKYTKKKRRRVTPLTAENWGLILNYTSEDARLQFARDVFVLCTLLNGMYASDLLRLRRDQLQGEFVELARVKTGGEYKAYISKPIRAILGRLPPSMPYLFPVLRPGMSDKTQRRKVASFGERVNAGLKEIAKELKIHQFTLRQARDTLATVSRNMGAREEAVSYLLAHSDLRMTRHYLGGITDAEIKEIALRIAGL